MYGPIRGKLDRCGVCECATPTSLVQLASALTLGVIAVVRQINVPAASTVQDPLNVILPTFVLIASARMTFALLYGAMATESASLPSTAWLHF